jgi:hypothetical protein
MPPAPSCTRSTATTSRCVPRACDVLDDGEFELRTRPRHAVGDRLGLDAIHEAFGQRLSNASRPIRQPSTSWSERSWVSYRAFLLQSDGALAQPGWGLTTSGLGLLACAKVGWFRDRERSYVDIWSDIETDVTAEGLHPAFHGCPEARYLDHARRPDSVEHKTGHVRYGCRSRAMSMAIRCCSTRSWSISTASGKRGTSALSCQARRVTDPSPRCLLPTPRGRSATRGQGRSARCGRTLTRCSLRLVRGRRSASASKHSRG